LADYELLDLLLMFAIPRRDTKPVAKRLLAEFGSVAGVLDQPPEALCKVEGIGPQSAILILAVRDLIARYFEHQIDTAPALDTPESVVAFARLHIGRFRCFTRAEIAKRNDSLDISWLRDDSVRRAEDLPGPADLADQILAQISIATEEMQALAQLLGEGE